MNKLTLMSQKTLRQLVLYAVGSEPGITTTRLWGLVSEWDKKTTVFEFDSSLAQMVKDGEVWVTNKCWQLPGATPERKLKGPTKEDPRQTRMFG